MTIKFYDDGGYLVEGRDSVKDYQLATIKVMLKMEMRTGMQASRKVSALQAARNYSGINFRSRQQAMDWVTAQV